MGRLLACPFCSTVAELEELFMLLVSNVCYQCIACTVLNDKSALADILHGGCITLDLCEIFEGDYRQVQNVAIDDSNLGMHRCG